MSVAAADVVTQIGETAGRVYRSLEIKKDQSADELRKSIKINGDLLQQAIGWLARESKINLTTNLKGELRLSLR